MKSPNRAVRVLTSLAVVFALGLSGCGTQSGSSTPVATNTQTPDASASAQPADSATPTPEPLEEVSLKVYLYTYMQETADTRKVLDEVNQILKEKINATFDFTMDMVADAEKKIPLILASGENYDGMMMRGMAQEVEKGGLMEIGDLLNTYSPERMKGMTDYDYTSITYNGKIYAAPGGFQWFVPQGYVIRGDLRKKYNIPEVTDLASFQNYLEVLQEKEKGVIPFNTSAADIITFGMNYLNAAGYVTLTGSAANTGLGYFMDDDKLTLSYAYELPQFKEYMAKTKEFADKGLWSKNAYAAKNISLDAFKAGASFAGACHVVNANDTAVILKSKQPDWEVEFFRIQALTSRPTRGVGLAVPRVSKNPERLIMALEEIYTDEKLNTLLNYGIEGTHFTLSDGGKIINTEQGVSNYPAGQFPLVWSNININFMKQVEGGIPELMDIQKKVDEYGYIPKHSGFNLNTEAISNEISAISAVHTEFRPLYAFGAFDDADALIKEYKEKLEKAGAEKVKAEVQRQLDEFLASKK